RIQEALALAQELSHPYSLAHALLWAAFLHQFRREAWAAQERAQEAMILSVEQGFPLFEALGIILQGAALIEQGRQEAGIRQMRQGLTSWQALGAGIMQPYYLALLAEAYGNTGRNEEGVKVLAEALALVAKTGERQYEAEIYRLKGELMFQPHAQGAQSKGEAEGYFLRAVRIAQQQQAKALELRAVMSLARLWQSQGKKEEARQMLADIYNWFTEGFDTKDVQEAKTLLEELH
ncbi:MAG: hypothetical protein HY268_03840, partial [Deltaproteobacteria bacterium]|nr:hypothetical protein [Deltaproteobacteria bacterium]